MDLTGQFRSLSKSNKSLLISNFCFLHMRQENDFVNMFEAKQEMSTCHVYEQQIKFCLNVGKVYIIWIAYAWKLSTSILYLEQEC